MVASCVVNDRLRTWFAFVTVNSSEVICICMEVLRPRLNPITIIFNIIILLDRQFACSRQMHKHGIERNKAPQFDFIIL